MNAILRNLFEQQALLLAKLRPIAPDTHDFRDRGDPMIKILPGAPSQDLDTAGRPMKEGT